uniref:hypothetical protein n=1 Tax=Algoriphagus sp. TaxID=1872435 RepID=UPI004047C0F0
MLENKDLKTRQIIFTFFVFLIVVLPSFVMIQFNQSSLALGVALGQSIIVFLLLFSKNLAKINLKSFYFFLFILFFIFFHSLICFLITNNFNFERAIGSIVIFSIIFFSVSFFNNFLYKNDFLFNQILIFVFYILSFLGLLSIVFNITFFSSYKILNKGVFPFFEPSHFILSLAPFLFYYYCSEIKIRYKLLVYFTSIILLIFLNNLTMLLIIGTSSLLVFSKKWHTYVFFFLVPFLFFGIQNLDYYSARLNLSNDDNLSTLVWLQGWENAFINFKETYGLGVGFQQFGINGLKGDATNAIAFLRAGEGNTTLNQLDGGTLGAKLFGEFGFFGLILIFFLFFLSLKSFFKLRRIQNIPNLQLNKFMLCVLSVFVFELFVRSMSYISNNVVLLILSFIYFKNKNTSNVR